MNLPVSVILAEGGEYDRLFFKDVLHELTIPTHLTTVNDGEQWLTLLNNAENVLAQVLVLDINMPRKGGFNCLAEIKGSDRLRTLPIIICSTSFDTGLHQPTKEGFVLNIV